MKVPVKKVMIFRPASIGDCLMGKYFLENIRAQYPSVHCTLVVSSRAAMVRDLFAAYPWVEVLKVNKNPTSLVRFFSRGQQDIVVTSYTGGVFGILPKLAARAIARVLVGYSDRSKFNRFLYDKLVVLRGRSRAPRLLECDALEVLGIPPTVVRPSFTYLPQPALLPRLGLEEKKYVVLHLFSGGQARGLSPARKQALIEVLAAAVPRGTRLVLTGSDKERESLGERFPACVLKAHTSLQELAHLMDHAALVVSLDTGAAHLAAHMGKPLIVLASCVGVQWWAPEMYGFDKLTAGGAGTPTELFTRLDICKEGHDYSGYAQCLDAIDMQAVATKAAQILRQLED